MKKCTKCGLVKDFSEFHKKSKQKSGLNPACKACVRIDTSRYYAENASKVKERVRNWATDNSAKVREARKAKYYANPEVSKARSKGWAQKNRDRRREIVAKSDAKCRPQRTGYARSLYWRDVERSREIVRHQQALRRASGNIPFEWWTAILGVVETGICLYCGHAGHKLTMDHWVAVKHGGKTEAGNLVPCCQSCNSKKGAKTPAEWKKIAGLDHGNPQWLTIEQFLECSRQAFEEWRSERHL